MYYLFLAEREGFEPSIRGCRIHAFQACAFDRSATSPIGLIISCVCYSKSYYVAIWAPTSWKKIFHDVGREGLIRSHWSLTLKGAVAKAPASRKCYRILSNPRYGVAVYTLSRRVPSTARPPLQHQKRTSQKNSCFIQARLSAIYQMILEQLNLQRPF